MRRTQILDHIRDKIQEFDHLDAESTILSEMKNSSTESFLRESLEFSELMKELHENEDILVRYNEAMITIYDQLDPLSLSGILEIAK